MAFKRFILLSLFFGSMLGTTTVLAQEIPVQLGQALTSGNVKSFSKHFDDRVEIVLDGESRDYSQQQAQVVLNEFLGNLEDVSYEMIHEETSKNHSTYYIGKLTSKSGFFRVYVNVKLINGENFIQVIKFEKQ